MDEITSEQIARNRERVDAERRKWREDPEGMEMALRHRCFMDGIDWQHHLTGDAYGTLLFPDEESLREVKTCLSGGCGVVEVEVRLIRWIEHQDLKYE